ncbi:MAG: thioredoxin-like domain-containing protein [Bacteroidales bacterium]|jgi:thiol-disulfide isomerase/thioredoxin|nr:thioredoxin-like domain-containing protein [Bacteroidales bacterium]
MKKIILSLISIIFLLINTNLYSQNSKIEITINGLSNIDIYIAHHYGNKQFIDDTVRLDDNGSGVYEKDSLFDQGIYLIVLPSKSYFEILMGNDQQFSLETNKTNFINNLKYSGSKENQEFCDYQKYMIEKQSQSGKIQKRLRELGNDNDSVKIYKAELKNIDKEVKNKWDKIAKNNPGELISIIVNSMKNPEIPEIHVPDNIENKDSLRWFHSYNYNKQHYFDNIDLKDVRLLRTPIFHKKMDYYFKKVLIQNPDSLIKYLDKFVNEVSANDELFTYAIRYFVNNFQGTKIMGLDKVFVHVAEKYYLSGEVDWVSEETIQKLRENVAKIKPNLIGEIARDLKMETSTDEYARLHDIRAKYTLVYFWEPNCGHCKKTTPKIYDIYKKYDRNQFEVFAVYTQGDKTEWLEYLNKNDFDWINVYDQYNLTNFRFFYNIYSTPTIYLLDKDKKIIAKRIDYKTIETILEQELEKNN